MEFSGQYLTYQEYISLGGTLDQLPFNILEFEARKKVDERTRARLKDVNNIPEEVKMCMFKLINSIQSYSSNNKIGGKNIASETTDGYTVSYVTGSNIQELVKAKDIELDDIIDTYLTWVIVNGEHIIYLGVE